MFMLGFPDGSVVKNLPANTGDTRDMGSIPGSGRSLGVGNGNPLQYSCLETSMDLPEAEEIKKRWQQYTEELYKKDLHDPNNHNSSSSIINGLSQWLRL